MTLYPGTPYLSHIDYIVDCAEIGLSVDEPVTNLVLANLEIIGQMNNPNELEFDFQMHDFVNCSQIEVDMTLISFPFLAQQGHPHIHTSRNSRK